jgi:hypothetical protein
LEFATIFDLLASMGLLNTVEHACAPLGRCASREMHIDDTGTKVRVMVFTLSFVVTRVCLRLCQLVTRVDCHIARIVWTPACVVG